MERPAYQKGTHFQQRSDGPAYIPTGGLKQGPIGQEVLPEKVEQETKVIVKPQIKKPDAPRG